MTVSHSRPTPRARPPAQRRQALELTRRTLHGIAEPLLAGYRYRVIRRIALRVRPDGFSCLDLPPADDSGPTRPSPGAAPVAWGGPGMSVGVAGLGPADDAASSGVPGAAGDRGRCRDHGSTRATLVDRGKGRS
jgi:hypothetical protein